MMPIYFSMLKIKLVFLKKVDFILKQKELDNEFLFLSKNRHISIITFIKDRDMPIIDFNDLQYSIEKEMDEKQNKPIDKNKQSKPSKQEDGPNKNHMVEAKKTKGKNVFDFLNELPGKVESINKKFRLQFRKNKNRVFYRKYLDRVRAGLYERYGDQARVEENNMVDDPVIILKGPAESYIRSLVKNINSLYETVTKMAKELETKTTAEAAIPVVQAYCKDALSQTVSGSKVNKDKQTWKEKILHSTKYKIAKILLSNRDTQVYGYTAKNIVLKGYPKPNHLIVTLFVENPEESPQEQSVKSIFRSAESFDILADADKQDVFNVSNMCEAILSKTVDNKVMNEIKERKNKCLSNFKNAKVENKKDNGKILDSIWDGINASCKELLSRKAYLIDCINIYFDMILRIDNLGVKAIKEMLEVEAAHRDTRYNTGLSHKKLDENNKYADIYPDGEHKLRSRQEKRDQYNRMNDAAKKLNKM